MEKKHMADRGSAIVIVLVAVSFAFILLSTILYVSLDNILMRYSGARIKDNFYTSEEVLEQMRAGLQSEASETFSDIYRKTLSHYRSGAGATMLSGEYLESLKDKLEDPDEPGKWDPDVLKGYVDPGAWEHVDEDAFLSEADGMDIRPHEMTVSSDGIVLKNIYVRYVGPSSSGPTAMTSIIQTDLAIGDMAGDYISSATSLDLFDYAVIAGESMGIGDGTRVTSIESIYGGDQGMSIGDGGGGAALEIQGDRKLATKGTLRIHGGGRGREAMLSTGPLTELFARDIVVDGGEARLGGLTAVFDDLVFEGAPGTVSVSGDYIGFGDSDTDPSKSSAVLIHAKGATLDADGSRKFVLSGRAFVGEGTGTSRFAQPNGGTGGAVPTGQSISAKADQVAYMIPPECIGVSLNMAEGKAVRPSSAYIGRNPVIGVSMNTAEGTPDLKAYLAERGIYPGDGFQDVDFDTPVYSLGDRPLKDFSPDRKYAVRYVQSQYGETIVYYYLLMTPDQASDYLDTYYAQDAARADRYFMFYEPDVRAAEDGAFVEAAGQYYTTDGDRAVFHPRGTESGNAVLPDRAGYESRFYSLCAKLVDTGADGMRDRNIFDNMLKTEESMPGNPETIEAAIGEGERRVYAVGSGKNEVLGILTRESVLDLGADGPLGSDTGKVRAVISTGSVIVRDTFKGMIIARGTVTCAGDGEMRLEKDRTGLARIFQSRRLRDGTRTDERLIDYFLDGDRYQFALDGIATEEQAEGQLNGTASANAVDYGSLVHYENYVKR